MKYLSRSLLLASFFLIPITGCGGGPAEETIKTASADDPLLEPMSLLQRYADGQKMQSEAMSFDFMVKRVKEVDPAKGAILEEGLSDLKKASESARKKKAKELLEKLKGASSPAS